MAAPASLTVPSSPNPSIQGSPRTRDWSNLRTGEPGSAFRGISRGRGSRGGGIRGGRGSSANLGSKGGSLPDTANNTPSPSPIAPSALRKLPAPTSAPTPSASSEKAINGSADRGGRPKSGSRKQPRPPPVIVTSTIPPPKAAPTGPPTPSRSTRRRRPPQGKTPSTTSKAPSSAVKVQNSRVGSSLSSQTILRKDVPPHLAAAHEAEIRHDVDVLVERVRAVAMSENRPMTPGSHIDWAGDEDDSLPDLDDWGIATTHDKGQSEEISPILEDSLKTLPEPNSEVRQEEDQETEGFNVELDQVQELSIEPSLLPSPANGAPVVLPATEDSPDQCIIAATAVELSPPVSDGKLSLHPSLPPKPVAAMKCLRARGKSISKPSDLPPKPSVHTEEGETVTTKNEGLTESIHAPPADERLALETVSRASSGERGLTASIHAPVAGLPESHSAPSLLSDRPTSVTSRSHSRSQTEGRTGTHQSHSGPSSTMSHRGRSDATSPLGKHVYTHSRNHSTPATGSRLPQTSRPVITGEAISRLARTIGGHGPASRAQAIPVTKDSTIS